MLKVNESYDLLETSRGLEARQREGALEVSVFVIVSGACWSVWRKKSQNNGYFSNLLECAIEYREAIEASRSDAPGASQMMTRRGEVCVGAKRRSPLRASSSSDCRCPPGMILPPLSRQHLFFCCVAGSKFCLKSPFTFTRQKLPWRKKALWLSRASTCLRAM